MVLYVLMFVCNDLFDMVDDMACRLGCGEGTDGLSHALLAVGVSEQLRQHGQPLVVATAVGHDECGTLEYVINGSLGSDYVNVGDVFKHNGANVNLVTVKTVKTGERNCGTYYPENQLFPDNRVRIFTHTIFINGLIYRYIGATLAGSRGLEGVTRSFRSNHWTGGNTRR